MGWYVKTPDQLLDSGWEQLGCRCCLDHIDAVISFNKNGMGVYCGLPYEGKEPPEGKNVEWKGWYWIREMLIWIPE